MPDSQIFKATYSGIPVFEMMVKGVAVMRRRADSWLNATQILKVAGFDKPQRTRILEREVQKGEHEKVQGGYGKYQGTWIPIERGLQLARQYNCEHLLQPIIDFQPEAKSPPLAPKHLISGSTTAKSTGTGKHAGAATSAVTPTSSGMSTRSRRNASVVGDVDSEMGEEADDRGSEDGSMTPSPSEASSSSRTPSPIGSPRPTNGSGRPPRKMRRTAASAATTTHDRHQHPETDGRSEVEHLASYADQMLEYFISDANQIPAILISPPRDFNPNMAIDDDGHTALHWAAAMGRVRVVKLLLSAGADIYNVNKAGQTALMRSVMFANNYDVRKFPELYELLHRSTLNIDHHNRTVFHHIVDVAMSKGKTHAARYYMETVLARLADYPTELADVVNFQDEDGESALTMAARCRSKRLVKLLIDVGANPKLTNADGKSAEDYILEDERFRTSPAPSSRISAMSYRNAQVIASNSSSIGVPGAQVPQLRHSAAAARATTTVAHELGTLLDGLASSFDAELRSKERDAIQAHALLSSIQSEILEAQRAAALLRTQAAGLGNAHADVHALKTQLAEKMGRGFRLGWERWLRDEEEREREFRDAGFGASIGPHAPYREDLTAPDGMGLYFNMHAASTATPTAEEMPRTRTKRSHPPDEEDIRDLATLHEDIPSDPAALQAACDALRTEVAQSRTRRKEVFDAVVRCCAESGAGGRMAEYRRLIGAGCGGIPTNEVDAFVGMLLEALEQDEPAASAVAWSGTTSTSRVSA